MPNNNRILYCPMPNIGCVCQKLNQSSPTGAVALAIFVHPINCFESIWRTAKRWVRVERAVLLNMTHRSSYTAAIREKQAEILIYHLSIGCELYKFAPLGVGA